LWKGRETGPFFLPSTDYIHGAMQILVTRFHLLLLAVTLAIAGVGAARIPADFLFLAHWQGNVADWRWPREVILLAPLLQMALLAAFFFLGRTLTKNQYAKSQHILDPALTTIMVVVAALQLGLLLTGIGSDLDFIRVTSFGLGVSLLVLGIVLFEAERHTYAGLRMPWPVRSDHAWRWVHRCAGLAYGIAGMALLAVAWFDMGLGLLIVSCAAALFVPAAIAGLATWILDRR
jgi:uncharacterized membrane protein